MCPTENIPPVDRLGRIVEDLSMMEEFSDEPQDIHEVDRGAFGTPLQLPGMINRSINQMDVDGLEERLLNEDRVPMAYELPSDYENVFLIPGFSRRSDRRVVELAGRFLLPPREHQDLILEWAEMCYEDPEPMHDLYVPGDMTIFAEIMLRNMPKRLTLDTWIGSVIMEPAAEVMAGEDGHRWEFRDWQASYGDGETIIEKLADGSCRDVIPFLGEAKPGRLIWRRPEGFRVAYTMEEVLFYEKTRVELRRMELTLVSFARRIARHVTDVVVFQYALPEAERQGRTVLDRHQIERAVKEIVGEEWFDLPFDLDNSLRNWSIDDVMKPDNEMEGWNVFIETDKEEDETGYYLHI
ncbi:hypothetical protein LTR37_011638 [Vermiconidia calcicola]|uniref:Uncharacterized protein n=1 Tax=Vermiconidia calcicola TaxID=1690605 RepID=A0ACC3N1D6_9PEZI|nr:hypothetical protein LTR37_011638 [Vermiconidia calcicola]